MLQYSIEEISPSVCYHQGFHFYSGERREICRLPLNGPWYLSCHPANNHFQLNCVRLTYAPNSESGFTRDVGKLILNITFS